MMTHGEVQSRLKLQKRNVRTAEERMRGMNAMIAIMSGKPNSDLSFIANMLTNTRLFLGDLQIEFNRFKEREDNAIKSLSTKMAANDKTIATLRADVANWDHTLRILTDAFGELAIQEAMEKADQEESNGIEPEKSDT